jgi:hypothetical protein
MQIPVDICISGAARKDQELATVLLGASQPLFELD